MADFSYTLINLSNVLVMKTSYKYKRGVFANNAGGAKSRVSKDLFELINHVTNDNPLNFINYIIKNKLNRPNSCLPIEEDYDPLENILDNVKKLHSASDETYQPQILSLVSKDIPYKVLVDKGFEITNNKYNYSKKIGRTVPYGIGKPRERQPAKKDKEFFNDNDKIKDFQNVFSTGQYDQGNQDTINPNMSFIYDPDMHNIAPNINLNGNTN